MPIDLTQLTGLQGLVKRTQVTSDSETNTFRDFKDVREGLDLLRDQELGCDATKKHNVMQNAMGGSVQRVHYPNNC